jgi:hypothetical protein
VNCYLINTELLKFQVITFHDEQSHGYCTEGVMSRYPLNWSLLKFTIPSNSKTIRGSVNGVASNLTRWKASPSTASEELLGLPILTCKVNIKAII